MSKTLIAKVLKSVDIELRPLGFSLRKSNVTFHRRNGDRMEILGLPVAQYHTDHHVRPWAGVRFDEVEQIMHRTSGFLPQFQSGTHTVGVELWRVFGEEGYDIIFRNEGDVAAVVSRLVEILQKNCIPYYDQFPDLRSVDASLNNFPNERNISGGLTINRCSRGIIVAKLTGRKNFDELADIYHSQVKNDNRGFYLPSFEALLSNLSKM